MSHTRKFSSGEHPAATTGLRDFVASHSIIDVKDRGDSPADDRDQILPNDLLSTDPHVIRLEDATATGRNGTAATMHESSGGIASLIRRANHDELTGLANRNWFLTAVEQERRSPHDSSSALFLIDLDGFKAVNDRWGHGAGDAVLAEVGHRLEQAIDNHGLAARFGGDEFAVWAPNCTETDAVLLAERIIASLSEPVPGEAGLSVGASVGWTMCSNSSTVLAQLSRADIALYAVKERGGRSQQQFDRTLAAQRVEGRVLQREVRQAIENCLFHATRQHIATMDGRSVGYEMLARWSHPRRGLLAPAAFLPAVLAAGKGADFDRCMMEKIFTSIEAGNGADTTNADPANNPGRSNTTRLPAWVNLTQYSLTQSTVDYLADRLSSGTIAPSQLVVEVSEDSRSESNESVEVLEALADLGVKIAIDDFGSGYSRLGAMLRLPISYVKIDRQFVHGASLDKGRMRILRAVIELIKAIGAESVAEGVETEQDRLLLADLGCDYMQGFLYHRPDGDRPDGDLMEQP